MSLLTRVRDFSTCSPSTLLAVSSNMGRIRAKSKKAALAADAPAAPKSAPTIPALLEKAQGLIVQCNYELAQQFAQRVLQREPRHADAREMVGVCQLETGALDEAKQVRECARALRADHSQVPCIDVPDARPAPCRRTKSAASVCVSLSRPA
jgi:Flp pilus assembly protein TadD